MIDQTPNLPGERWLPVVGYEGAYDVSDFGRVRSVSRTIVTKRGQRKTFVGRILAQALSGSGYPFVGLSVEGSHKPCSVHRLVMLAFEPRGDADSMEVNHMDGNKTRSVLSNLEWTTISENRRHSVHVLGHAMAVPGRGTKNPQHRPVVRVNLDNGAEVTFETMEQARADGFDPTGICAACCGRQKTHRGFGWRYADTPKTASHNPSRAPSISQPLHEGAAA